MRRMQTMLASLALSVTMLCGPALADDASDIKTAISSQLEAFRTGDKDAAYSYASPKIKAMFPSSDVFMSMVERGYDPVYHSRNVVFGEMKPEGAGFRQEVFLTDTGGQSWVASYTLERQPDGSMKITGVFIRKGNDLAA